MISLGFLDFDVFTEKVAGKCIFHWIIFPSLKQCQALSRFAWGAPGGRGGAAGRGVERRAPRSCLAASLSPPLQKQLLPEARGAARSGGAFLASSPSGLAGPSGRESGAGPGRTRRERAETARAGGRRAPPPPRGPRAFSPSASPLALPPHLFSQCCGRQRCGAEFLKGARMC